MREKIKSMHIGGLIKSFESSIDIKKKVEGLLCLGTFMAFKNLFRVKKQYLLVM